MSSEVLSSIATINIQLLSFDKPSGSTPGILTMTSGLPLPSAERFTMACSVASVAM